MNNHISFDLAQQLKIAGFPQDKTQFIARKYSLASDPIIWGRPPEGLELATLSGKLEWEVALPTTSELIRECGDGLRHMQRDNYFDGKESSTEYFWFINKEHTPHHDLDEALAKLWIRLNTK